MNLPNKVHCYQFNNDTNEFSHINTLIKDSNWLSMNGVSPERLIEYSKNKKISHGVFYVYCETLEDVKRESTPTERDSLFKRIITPIYL